MIISLVVIGILTVAASAYLYLKYDEFQERRLAVQQVQRESVERYHSQLADKYAATMTDEDREWYNRLPDWDRMPLRENGVKK